MITFLLIVHGLVGVGLLGAITHQAVAVVWPHAGRKLSFGAHYRTVNPHRFTTAIIVLFVAGIVLGAVIYPYYRLNVRIPFEEMQLGWAVGMFELKEHFAGIALGILPAYALAWRPETESWQITRVALTLLLASVVWFDFLVGHVLNNIRGFT